MCADATVDGFRKHKVRAAFHDAGTEQVACWESCICLTELSTVRSANGANWQPATSRQVLLSSFPFSFSKNIFLVSYDNTREFTHAISFPTKVPHEDARQLRAFQLLSARQQARVHPLWDAHNTPQRVDSSGSDINVIRGTHVIRGPPQCRPTSPVVDRAYDRAPVKKDVQLV